MGLTEVFAPHTMRPYLLVHIRTSGPGGAKTPDAGETQPYKGGFREFLEEARSDRLAPDGQYGPAVSRRSMFQRR